MFWTCPNADDGELKLNFKKCPVLATNSSDGNSPSCVLCFLYFTSAGFGENTLCCLGLHSRRERESTGAPGPAPGSTTLPQGSAKTLVSGFHGFKSMLLPLPEQCWLHSLWLMSKQFSVFSSVIWGWKTAVPLRIPTSASDAKLVVKWGWQIVFLGL